MIPPHLAIAIEAAGRVRSGKWITNDVLIAGLADLESFVRTNPADQILITDKPLDPFPITKHVVGTFEDLAQETNGKVPLGYAAIQRIGVLVTAVRALEEKTQELESRLAKLEDSHPG
ncbi:hypothetical protein BST24_02955 [Mycobacteroides franklinii]|nr:hypothetical protein BST24_02955 [Mycobacteroides franklinii]